MNITRRELYKKDQGLHGALRGGGLLDNIGESSNFDKWERIIDSYIGEQDEQ